jgi:hypothetical protein
MIAISSSVVSAVIIARCESDVELPKGPFASTNTGRPSTLITSLPIASFEVAPPPVSKELKKRWSYFIQKVYETNPLVCPKWTLDLPLKYPTKGRPFLESI